MAGDESAATESARGLRSVSARTIKPCRRRRGGGAMPSGAAGSPRGFTFGRRRCLWRTRRRRYRCYCRPVYGPGRLWLGHHRGRGNWFLDRGAPEARLLPGAALETSAPTTTHRRRGAIAAEADGIRTAVVAAVLAAWCDDGIEHLHDLRVADWGRSAGRLQRHSFTSVASIGGTAGRRRSTGSVSSTTWAASTACAGRPEKGGEPVSISYAMMPSA